MKLFKALMLLSTGFAASAHAQTFTSPPDVGTYSPVAATYPSGSTQPVLGNGQDAKGGVAPAFSTHPEPTNEPNEAVATGWTTTSGVSPSCVAGSSSSCGEKKFRTAVGPSHILYDDPIRYWGKPGGSHCHEFFGNDTINAYSTRIGIRARPASAASGGILNATGYWEPCWGKTIGGKRYAMTASHNIIYYTKDSIIGGTQVDDLQPLHPLLRFVMGTDMDDPDDTAFKAEIAAANAQPGTPANRYTYKGNGFRGYQCALAGGGNAAVKGGLTASPGFTLADGSDPWEGRCVDGSKIYAEALAPECWDGVNVSSPSGYRHFRQAINDSTTGKDVCPNGWYKVPRFEVKTFHNTRGPSDYMTWKLESDDMMAAKLGRAVVPGASFHADWMNGWNKTILNTWQSFCLGIGSNAPHGCDYSSIDASTRLISNGSPAPDGSRVEQVPLSLALDTNDPTKLHLIDTARASHVNMKGM